MKYFKILFPIIAAVMFFTSCSDNNDGGVKIDPPVNGFTFKPAPGGAIMHYVLPDNDQITGLQVSYIGEDGKGKLFTGSATSDSLQLVGFNHAQEKVTGYVSYIMRDQSKSEPIEVEFNTLDSAPVEFLNSVKVASNWNGFSISFDNDAETRGIVHVFYLGVDPLSNLPDTILMNSFYLEKSSDEQIKNYRMQQNVGDKVSVVVKAEDFSGNLVGQKSWNDVKMLEMEKASYGSDFQFYCDNIVTDDFSNVGLKYLFDGDLTGVSQTQKENYYDPPYSKNSKFCTFLAGPDAFGEDAHPWYFDMKKDNVLANLRIYSMLSWWDYETYRSIDAEGDIPGNEAGFYITSYWENRTPCDVTLYGMKDNGQNPSSYEDLKNMSGEWVKIGSFYENPNTSPSSRYCPHAGNKDGSGQFTTMAALQAASPEFLEIVIPASEQGSGYRYLKLVINDTFKLSASWQSPANTYNNKKYVIAQELEINKAKK